MNKIFISFWIVWNFGGITPIECEKSYRIYNIEESCNYEYFEIKIKVNWIHFDWANWSNTICFGFGKKFHVFCMLAVTCTRTHTIEFRHLLLSLEQFVKHTPNNKHTRCVNFRTHPCVRHNISTTIRLVLSSTRFVFIWSCCVCLSVVWMAIDVIAITINCQSNREFENVLTTE